MIIYSSSFFHCFVSFFVGNFQSLSGNLQNHSMLIIYSSHWALILKAIHEHAKSAKEKGWSMPTLVDFDDNKNESNEGEERVVVEGAAWTMRSTAMRRPHLELKEVFPYWLMRKQAVCNDVDLEGTFFLTAPNMSGKSTLMRSVLVAALLANCGLFVAASAAVVPRFDLFFLRTASYDVPTEAMSALAFEMDDMKVLTRYCTSQSLIMIDELGEEPFINESLPCCLASLKYIK